MKKTEILKKNYEFKNVLAKGKFYRQKEIEMFIQKNKENANYLGIAIGKKNGKSFQRNRAKRIIRECYTKLENEITDGYSIVILMNKDFCINNMTFSEVFLEMKNILKMARILREEEKL